MATKTMTLNELSRIEREREAKIYKADELMQKARFSLSLTEQRLILYAISKIQPNHDASEIYKIDMGDFFKVCGISDNESYTRTKDHLKRLADKSWWLKQDRSESLVRWFSVVRIFEQSGVIHLKFHEDMFPYLFELARRMRENGRTYTSYEFRYVLPMRSTYSIRLYELLKSYQKNNQRWFFNLNQLKNLLDCENYGRYPDFRRFVLEPAVNEINKFTDIKISAEPIKQGRKVESIEFAMLDKDFAELLKANQVGLTELDGNIHYWDIKNKEK